MGNIFVIITAFFWWLFMSKTCILISLMVHCGKAETVELREFGIYIESRNDVNVTFEMSNAIPIGLTPYDEKHQNSFVE